MKIQARKYTTTTIDGCDVLNAPNKFTFLMGVDEEVTGGRIIYQRGSVLPTVEVYTIGNENGPQVPRVFVALHCEDSVEIDECAIVNRISQMQDPQTENVYHLFEIR